MDTLKRLQLTLVAILSACMLSVASADDSPQSSSGGIEEILVTAQRRQSSVQDVPAAISAASGVQLQEMGITEVRGLDALTPSARFTTLRQQTLIYMRGIGQSLSAPNADPAIAVNVNDIYIPAEMTGSAFYDLDRVEVLPGPQGTLYGRNAAGGVVNVITHRPTHDFGASGTLELGNYGLVNGTGALNLPISDTLAVRAAGNRNQHDGYFSNGAMDRATTSGRLSALYTPSEATSVYAVGSYSHDGGIGPEDQNIPPKGNNWYLPFDPRANGLFTDASTWTSSLEVRHEFAKGNEFTYLAGFSDLDGRNRVEFLLGAVPATPATVLGVTHSRLLTQEARLAGSVGSISWLTGLYYYDAKVNFFTNSEVAPPVHILNGPFQQNAKGYAGFAQGILTVTDRTRVTVGARYSYDQKNFDGSNSREIVAGQPTNIQPYAGDRNWDHFDWRVALEYDLSAHSLVYGSVQTGYNQGGFSTTPVAPKNPEAATFNPETVLAYTVGSKNMFFDNRAIINIELFYYNYNDYQVSARNLITAQNQVFNAQKAEIYGADFNAEWRLTLDDKIQIDGALLHAKATELVLPVAPFANYSGNDLPYAPRITARGAYIHSWSLPNNATLNGEASYRWIDNMWGVYNHLDGTYIPSHSYTDASLTYRPAGKKWSVALWGLNLANTFTYALVNGNAIPGPGAGGPEPPRTYGIRFTVDL
jgi:iron complex outermembrane receptor protein